MKRVAEVYMVGMDELLVKVVAKDREEFLSVMEKINRMEKVNRVSALSSIKVFKERAEIDDLLD